MQHGKENDPADTAPPRLTPVTPPAGWARVSRWLGPLIAVALIALAVTVLRKITREITWSDVRLAVHAVPWPQIIGSTGFAAAAMVTMGLYDVLSCRLAGIRALPAYIAGLAGFAGYALSNALGFHIILGGSVRYRIYSANGLSAKQIAQILALSLGTIWFAVGTLFALVFIFEPNTVPLFGYTPAFTRLLGFGLAIAVIGIVVWLWPGRTALRLFGWTFPVPDGKGAVAQIALGLIDFGLATAALYVLLPHDLRPEFMGFALIFMTSFIAGSLSHSPGGLGVFEAGILLGLGAGNRPDAVAALIVFRLTYYILPLAVAVVALALMEATKGVRSWRWALRPLLVTVTFGAIATLVFLIADWLSDH